MFPYNTTLHVKGINPTLIQFKKYTSSIMPTTFYELFSSSNLSGINLQLKNGVISANSKMHLDQNSLNYTYDNRVVTVNDMGMSVVTLDSESVTQIDMSGLLLTEEDNSLRIHPKGINASSLDFLCENTGSITLQGEGITLDTNSSGIRLSGTELINTSSGPLVNKFLQVYIREGEDFVPYNIPLRTVL